MKEKFSKFYRQFFNLISSEAELIEKALYKSDTSQFQKYVDEEKSIHSYKCFNFKIDFFKDSQDILNVFLEPFDDKYDFAILLNTIKMKIKNRTKFYIICNDEGKLSSFNIGEIKNGCNGCCVFSKQFIDFIVHNLHKIIDVRKIVGSILLELSDIKDPDQYFEELLFRTWAKVNNEGIQITWRNLEQILCIDILSTFYTHLKKSVIYPSEFQLIIDYSYQDVLKYFFSN
jgi:hypothetical protein